MLFRERKALKRQESVRELSLLDGERIEERFVPDDGLVLDTPEKGHLLVLTNLRVMSFVETDGRKEMFLAPLDELKAVSVKASTRGLKDIVSGLGLMLIGVLSYFILGVFIVENVAIAGAIGAAISFVGLLFIVRHFFWEEEGSVTFQGGSWNVSFVYKSTRAGLDVNMLIKRFFQLKLGPNNSSPTPDLEPSARPEAPLSFPPPQDAVYRP